MLNVKIHTEDQTGPKRWSEKLSLKRDVWTKIFKSLKNICKETKLKEFQFKLIHRTIVTKKELFRFGIKADDERLFFGDKDSIEQSFIECMFTKLFSQKVLNWFNQVNASSRIANKHNNNKKIKIKSLLHVFVGFVHSYCDLTSI